MPTSKVSPNTLAVLQMFHYKKKKKSIDEIFLEAEICHLQLDFSKHTMMSTGNTN